MRAASIREAARWMLRHKFGHSRMREGQLETIEAVLSSESGVISVMATGSGKVRFATALGLLIGGVRLRLFRVNAF